MQKLIALGGEVEEEDDGGGENGAEGEHDEKPFEGNGQRLVHGEKTKIREERGEAQKARDEGQGDDGEEKEGNTAEEVALKKGEDPLSERDPLERLKGGGWGDKEEEEEIE